MEGERLLHHFLLFAQPDQELPARGSRPDDERGSDQFRRVRQRSIQFLSGAMQKNVIGCLPGRTRAHVVNY